MHGYPSRRRVKVAVPLDILASVLRVPEGASIRAFLVSHDPMCVQVVLDGEQFAEVEDNAETPFVRLNWVAQPDGTLQLEWPESYPEQVY